MLYERKTKGKNNKFLPEDSNLCWFDQLFYLLSCRELINTFIEKYTIPEKISSINCKLWNKRGKVTSSCLRIPICAVLIRCSMS